MIEEFWELACEFRSVYLVLVSVTGTLWLLSAASYPLLDPGSASRVIVQVNLALLSVIVTLAGYFYWRCRGVVPE